MEPLHPSSGYNFEKLKGNHHSEDRGVDERLILKSIIRNRKREYGLDLSASG
jgi:hypothetical protein